MQHFHPRARRFLGYSEHNGQRIKRYAISADRQWPGADWAVAEAKLLDQLPAADPAAGMPGLGFLIQHRGRGADYLVLAWWARENELPLRLRLRDHGGDWRDPHGNESVCVWDLELIGFERDAYVTTLLGSGTADDYLRWRASDLP